MAAIEQIEIADPRSKAIADTAATDNTVPQIILITSPTKIIELSLPRFLGASSRLFGYDLGHRACTQEWNSLLSSYN